MREFSSQLRRFPVLTTFLLGAVVVRIAVVIFGRYNLRFLLRCANSFTCRLLHDISQEHQSAKALIDDDKTETAHISALLCHENQLWVGTVDG